MQARKRATQSIRTSSKLVKGSQHSPFDFGRHLTINLCFINLSQMLSTPFACPQKASYHGCK